MKFEYASSVKIAGITSLLLGLFGFIFLMQYFQLFDTAIEFDMRWLRSFGQNFRFDKWNVCRG